MGALKFNKAVALFLIPAVLIFGLFFLYPFLETVFYSMYNWNGFTKPEFIGASNFIKMFSDGIFKEAVGRIFIWAVLAIIFKVGSALVIAYVLRNPFKGIKFFRTAVFLPYIISAAAMSLMFLVMYDKDIGLINFILRIMGLGSFVHSWLGDSKTAFYATIAIPIWQAIGYFFVILLAAMQDVPEELYDSGKIDGTNAVTTFLYITLPNIWGTFVVCIILSINGAFQGFDYIFILTGGGPGHASEVPATYMYKSIFMETKYGYGSAIAFTIFMLTLATSLIVRKTLSSRFSTSD